MTYYDEIDNPAADDWIRVGWRQRIEQAYRFEAALELIGACSGTVLDVGCGLGALSAYADGAGVQRSWIGIEPHEPFARIATMRHPVIAASFEDVATPDGVECAVAIGTLAGTQSSPEALVNFLAEAPTFLLVVLDRRALSSRAAFAEHRTNAVTIDELERLRSSLGPRTTIARISPTDLALVRGPDTEFRLSAPSARFAATVAGPWGDDESAEKKAWLACELGLRDEAARWLDAVERDSEFASLVRARFDRLQPVASAG